MTKQNNSGFTIIEVMIVVVIIGVLAAIAIPNFINMQGRAKEASVKSNMHSLQIAAEDFSTQSEGIYPVDLAQTVSLANPNVPNNNNSMAGEEPASGVLGPGALLAASIRNPVITLNNTAQTEHPSAPWDLAHSGTISVDFMVATGAQAAGSPSSASCYLISGYGVSSKLALSLQAGR